jgi:transcriptional regulator with XRE-family HTH domain
MPKTRLPDWKGRAFGRRLKIARSALGLTERKAAEAAQVSLKTWRNWEEGEPLRSSRPLINFANAAATRHVSLDWLFWGGTPEKIKARNEKAWAYWDRKREAARRRKAA